MALFLACIATKHRKIRYFYINIFFEKNDLFSKKHYGWNKQSATILVGKREHPLKSHYFGCLSLLYGPITFSLPSTIYYVNNCGKNCASFFWLPDFLKRDWHLIFCYFRHIFVASFPLSISNRRSNSIKFFLASLRNATCTRIPETIPLDYSIM